MKYCKTVALLVVMVAMMVPVGAQAQDDGEDCPALVDRALDMVGEACALLGRNEACYGNMRVDAAFWEAREQPDFEAPSDVVPLVTLSRVETVPMNPDREEWGIAVLSVQPADMDLSPGQAVTFLLLGDVQMLNENESEPMQAFAFTAGIGEPACEEAPSALVVQSPEDVAVTFDMNGMAVTLGSTVVLTMAEHEGDLALMMTLLEGEIQAAFSGTSFHLREPGEAAGVTLNAESMVGVASEVVQPRMDQLAPKVWNACTDAMKTGLFASVACDVEVREYGQTATGCIVSPSYYVNQRSGPGTNYHVQGSLGPYEHAAVNGQAEGTDGFIWWRLEDGSWVREDVVDEEGPCDAAPVAKDVPAPPSPAEEPPPASEPSEAQPAGEPPPPGRTTGDLWGCEAEGGEIAMAAGQPTTWTVGLGLWETAEAAEDAKQDVVASLSIGGAPATFTGLGPVKGGRTVDGRDGYYFQAYFTAAALTPGDHRVEGAASTASGEIRTGTCIVHAQ